MLTKIYGGIINILFLRTALKWEAGSFQPCTNGTAVTLRCWHVRGVLPDPRQLCPNCCHVGHTCSHRVHTEYLMKRLLGPIWGEGDGDKGRRNPVRTAAPVPLSVGPCSVFQMSFCNKQAAGHLANRGYTHLPTCPARPCCRSPRLTSACRSGKWA